MLTLEIEDTLNGRGRNVVLHGGNTPKRTAFFEMNTPLANPPVWDGYVCAMIFDAMQQGRSVNICGPLSEKFFRNIQAFQEAWHCHCPSLYQVVEIQPSELLVGGSKAGGRPESAMVAFSGGMDSAFSLLRHQPSTQNRQRLPIASALMVHGFDVPYSNRSAFDTLHKRVEKITEAVGVELHILRTTIRENDYHRWVDCHGAVLASVLHLTSDRHTHGIIASSDPYNYISYVHYAWGSSAATDYLLSGSEMEIIHDGAGFSRPQKIAYLAKNWPSQLKRTQFCWEGERRDINCGVCDKCVHTRLSLLAGGFDEGLCFETSFHIGMLDRIKISEAKLGDILPLLDFAEGNHCNARWTRLLRDRINPLLPPSHPISNRSLRSYLRHLQATLRERF